jgi:hypothetical protein
MSDTKIREVVKEKYGNAALRVTSGGSSCCGVSPAGTSCDPITSNLYDASEAGQIPEQAMLASLGCGNPTALAKLNAGETVLDLGSGGGIDVLLSAKRVGPTVLREAFRVLKPGGRFAVSDVVTRGEMLPEIRKSVLLWVGCIAGALQETEYRNKLASAGFGDVEVEATRVYKVEDAREFLSGQGLNVDALAPQVDGKFLSAFISAVKPASAKTWCGPDCCN